MRHYKIREVIERGPSLGDGVNLRTFALVVSSRDGVASQEQNRSSSDAQGELIGRFRMTLSPSRAEALRRAISRRSLAGVSATTPGGLGASDISISVDVDEAPSESVSFSSRDTPLIDYLDPLLSELMRTSVELDGHPQAALGARVEYLGSSPRSGTFALHLLNPGTEPIWVADPRRLRLPPDEFGGVRVAPYPYEVPGFTAPPLEWSRVALLPDARGSSDADVRIDPGMSFSFLTEEWSAPQAGRYLAQGIYSSYGGSGEREGVYRVRGACFSFGLEFEIV